MTWYINVRSCEYKQAYIKQAQLNLLSFSLQIQKHQSELRWFIVKLNQAEILLNSKLVTIFLNSN